MNPELSNNSQHGAQAAADVLPQAVCVLDGRGWIISANDALEQWRRHSGGSSKRVDLHAAFHGECSNPDCYLLQFSEHVYELLTRQSAYQRESPDPLLGRKVLVRAELLGRPGARNHRGAVVTVQDLSHPPQHFAQQASPGDYVAQEIAPRLEPEVVQAQLLTLLDRASTMIAMADASGALVYVNAAGRNLLHIDQAADITSMTIRGCHAPSDRERVCSEALAHASAHGEWAGEAALMTVDGKEVRCTVTLVRHKGDGGGVQGYSLVARGMNGHQKTEDTSQANRVQLRKFSAQRLTVQEAERRRIAADLHDGLGQSLSLLKISVEQATRALGHGRPNTAGVLAQLTPQVKSVLAELRNISMNLRPAMLDDLGIVATLSWFFREIENSGIATRVERNIRITEADVPRQLRTTVFRILQEAMNNALKHANAKCISVTLCAAGESLDLCIQDDGDGFEQEPQESSDNSAGLGLQTMRERAELSGGVFEMSSTRGKGTIICAHWPIAATRAPHIETPREQVRPKTDDGALGLSGS